MELEIVWSKKAASGYSEILKYLDKKWTIREVKNFEVEVDHFLRNLSKFSSLLKESKKTGLRKGPINKLTILTYRVNQSKNQLQIINIRSSRQYPS